MAAGKDKCYVVGCNKQHVSVHVLPAVQNRAAWLHFIFDGNVPATLPKKVVVCANHFTEDSFENYRQYTAGFARRLRLRENSVPTVRRKSAEDGAATASPTTREVGCQTEPAQIQKRTVGTQLSQRTLPPTFRSKGVQVTFSTKHTGVGVTSLAFAAPPPTVTSTPVKEPGVMEDMDIELEGSTSRVSSQGLDATHDPADSADILDATPTPVHQEKKYIVYEISIKELFQECPVCKRPCTIQTRRLGTFVAVLQKCIHCEFSRTWNSQPLLNSTPAGNLHLSAAVYLSGVSYITVQKVFRAMHLQTLLYDAFRRHARTYVEPAIVHKWKTSQDGMLQRLSMENAIVGGMRADSPGHSAKFCSYTMMDLKTNTVIDIQLVQSSEVGGTSNMEKEGLKRGLVFLKERGVNVDCIVTDRHPQVQKFLRENGINQYYNVWRMEKGISKKLGKICKKKDCQSLKKWLPAIKNHIYWTAATSTTGPERVAKWTSILNHVRDVHIHQDPFFPACLHSARQTKDHNKWLTAGTPAFYQLEKVLSTKKVLKDVAKLAPHHQASALEGFHRVILRFAPKNVVYPFLGVLCRLYLAALHFNENTTRDQASTSSEDPRHRGCFSKSHKVECRVKPIKTQETFRYVEDLTCLIMGEVFRDPEPYWVQLLQIDVPPDLSSGHEYLE
ncbi:uncharacterized protein LOC105936117 [Fundulus heteroclitus]|uniref:uncharacterized protein LOC105936117 n=1 Tax=Fundulus heteroclitus TaxID=8078 RepID=UPI00165C7941|nr:uncharacterized protein LOC105936117 [Fundulus heteroclitus]